MGYEIIRGNETKKEKIYKFPMTFEYTRTDYINAILEMEEQDIEHIRQTLNKRKGRLNI